VDEARQLAQIRRGDRESLTRLRKHALRVRVWVLVDHHAVFAQLTRLIHRKKIRKLQKDELKAPLGKTIITGASLCQGEQTGAEERSLRARYLHLLGRAHDSG